MADGNTTGIAASCRLYVILARAAPVAVIFRRGPSHRVRLILWHTDTDTFTPGQWFHGRIYERRCDLTPDGKYLVYFAAKHTHRQLFSSVSEAWTAISRPSYLTAIALWPKGDTYNGGGLWQDSDTLLLNHVPSMSAPHPDFLPPTLMAVVPGAFSLGEDGPIWNARLEWDGWRLTQVTANSYAAVSEESRFANEPPTIWEKASSDGRYRLLHTILGVGSKKSGAWYQEAFTLRRQDSEEDFPFPEGTCWADWDAQGRIVWARQGELWALTLRSGRAGRDPFTGATLLADFTKMKPEGVAPPEWAKIW